MTSFIKSPDHIHIVFDDCQSATIYSSQPNFADISIAVKNKQWDIARSLAFPSIELQQQFDDNVAITDNVHIKHGIVYLNDKPMHGTLINRMLDMAASGFDITPMAHFLDNLNSNPSFRAVNELYTFLEKSNLPITEDGHFLAYKRVTANFTDIRTETFDNTPGAVVSMERNEVNEDKDQTCSTGLHFCSYEYLPSYANSAHNKTVMLKINPRDVVSIPSDYNDAKGRCCSYTVVCEIKKESASAMPVQEARIENTKVMNVTPGAVNQIQIDKRFDNILLVLKTHHSVEAAAEATGIPKAAIKRVCNGKRKSTGGFGWEWVAHSTTKYPNPDEQNNCSEIKSDDDDDDDVELWRIK